MKKFVALGDSFTEGVGEFDAAGIEFEPLGHARVARARSRQRRLADRILAQDGRAPLPEMRLDQPDEDAAEQVGPGVVRRDAKPAGHHRVGQRIAVGRPVG